MVADEHKADRKLTNVESVSSSFDEQEVVHERRSMRLPLNAFDVDYFGLAKDDNCSDFMMSSLRLECLNCFSSKSLLIKSRQIPTVAAFIERTMNCAIISTWLRQNLPSL